MESLEVFSHMERELCLLCISDQQNNSQIEIHERPTFYDALQVLKPPLKQQKQYQILPLGPITSLTFLYHDKKIQRKLDMIIDLPARTITVQETEPSNAKAFRLLSYFMVKKDDKVMFMTQKPNTPFGGKIKEPSPTCRTRA